MSNVLYADMNLTDGFGDIGTKQEGPRLMYGFVIYMHRIGDKQLSVDEYQEWLQNALLVAKTLPLLSDLYYLRRTWKEKKEITMLTGVHWDGVVRKQHPSSQDR